MRRALVIVLVALAAGGTWLVAAGSGGGGSGPDYWVEFDNAFGLIKGGDVKIAGVRAGKVADLQLDRRTLRARVGIDITRDGFGSLRADVRCESRPQSLIGEYFVDCDPGTAPRRLRRGATIPVQATSSTIAPDLVNDILRRPQRERLSIILGELGAAVAGREEDLDGAVRRAAPALRQTDAVLGDLAAQRHVLADLTSNADRVIGDLAANRRDVGRFVTEARDTAATSAQRRAAIAAGIRELPGFLAQLRPAMRSLGRVADAQAPALRNLRASAGQLDELFTRLQPYAQASQPAFRALGRAARTGAPAVRAAVPVVDELRRFAKGTPELGGNLATVLQHLDDPAHAIEDDPRAARATGRPMPTGFSGLEALLSYVYDQTQSTNIYDRNSHILKISIIPPTSPCADYADVARARQVGKECATALGPSQPGISREDPTAALVGAAKTRARRAPAHRHPDDGVPAPPTAPQPPSQQPSPPQAPKAPGHGPPTLDLPPILPGLPDPPPIHLPLLDYLLGQ